MLRLVALVSSVTLVLAAGAALAAGSPAAGKKVYLSNGCGACHTFKPAGSKGTTGPALTRARLSADAKRAEQPYALFVRTSIIKPNAFVAKGYPRGVMPANFAKSLSKKQLNDLVAFVAKG